MKFRDSFIIIIITTSLLIAGDFILSDYANGLKKLQTSSQPVHRSKLPLEYYEVSQEKFWQDNETMIEQGFKKATFHPYYHYKSSKVETHYANIENNGLRKTIKNPKKDAKKIYMFGGSTLWGLGVPDKYTIPSIISEKIGPNFDLINFGEGSFVSGQEFNLLIEQLNNGNIPDAVIFYDGVNDAYAGSYSPGIPGSLTQHLEMEKVYKAYQERSSQDDRIKLAFKYTMSYIREVLGTTSYWKIASYLKHKNANVSVNKSVRLKTDVNELNHKAKRVIDIYENRIKQIKAISDAYGFKVYFFWQPDLMSGIRKPIGFEQEIVKSLGPSFKESVSKVYDYARIRFANQENNNIYFIADLFKDVDFPLYMDDCHVDARGNMIISAKIVNLLHEKLEQL